MIRSFKDKNTERLFQGFSVKPYKAFERQALRRLVYLHAAVYLEDLRLPPSNRLEKLLGDRKESYSLRINKQWRVCFIAGTL
jgi:proteic killer suppression protein